MVCSLAAPCTSWPLLLKSRNSFLTLVTSGDLHLKRSHRLVNLGRTHKGLATRTAFWLVRAGVTQISWQCWAIHLLQFNPLQSPCRGEELQAKSSGWSPSSEDCLEVVVMAQGGLEKEAKWETDVPVTVQADVGCSQPLPSSLSQ